MRIRRLILLFTVLCCATYSQAQVKKTEPSLTRVLFVFDASNSMKTKHKNTTRIEGAKELFYKFIDSLSKQKNIQFALRMYGHTVKYPPGDCKDSKLVVPFGKNNSTLIKSKVAEAKPTGITPIEHSLTESANDFPDTKAVNMIILITDGIEECEGDPCKARQKLMEKGIVFKPFIIGIGLTVEQIKTFECVGDYYDFDNTSLVTDISSIISKQKLNKTSAQVNLLDTKSYPSETNVNMTFYNTATGNYVYNYMHTLNQKNNPDTLYLDDFPTYKVIAHTIPPTESKDVKLTQGKHTIIPIDAPQGFIELRRPMGVYNFNEKIKSIIRKSSGNMQTLNVQQMNTTEKYITGSYDLEILTLPRTYIYGVKVEQSQTKLVELPNAGMLTVKALDNGDGCILKDTKKLEWVCNLNTSTSQTYFLQPGNYRIEWRAKSLKGSIYTIEKKFTIKSDVETKVDLYK
ncbi:MAG: VWA domain-containing protein [Bacteroidetes bacterium]|nr:VWA domain-containing protein [Bacteroidota bacterium]